MGQRHVTAKTLLNAETKTVWEHITSPANFGTYVHGYAGGRALTRHETGAGARYEWYGKIGPLKIWTTEEITEWQEGERVAYRGNMAGAEFESSMAVRAEMGGTLLTVAIQYRVPWYLGGALMDRLWVSGMVRRGVDRSLKNLKELFG